MSRVKENKEMINDIKKDLQSCIGIEEDAFDDVFVSHSDMNTVQNNIMMVALIDISQSLAVIADALEERG